MLLDDIPISIQYLIHHIGRIQVSAVDAGRLGPDQLQRRDVEGLAEGVGRQGDHVGVEGLLIGEDALALAHRHVEPRGVHEAEGAEVLVVLLGAHLQADGDKGGVAGVAGGHLQALGAVAGLFGAVEGLIPALDHDGAGTAEGGVHVHRALLQCRRQGDGLEGGAGLVGVGDAAVAPLESLGPVLDGLDGLAVILLFFKGVFFLLQRLQLRIHGGQELFIPDSAVIGGVEVGVGGHGDNCSGVYLHDDAGAAVFGVVCLQHALHVLLKRRLNPGVQGQHHVVPVLRVDDLLIVEGQVRVAGVLGGHGVAGGALQHVVELGLQAVGPLVLTVDKAHHVGRQGAVGVVPPGVQLQKDPLEGRRGLFRIRQQPGPAVLVDKGELPALIVDLAVHEAADLVGHVLLHPSGNPLILGRGHGRKTQDLLFLHAQDPAQAPGHIGLIQYPRGNIGLAGLLRLLPGSLIGLLLFSDKGRQLQRGDAYVFRRGGGGQGVVVPVINRPPGGGHRALPGLLAGSLVLEFVMPPDLQVVQLPKEHDKGDHAQQQHDDHRPAADHLVGPAGRFTFSRGPACHGASLSHAVRRDIPN